MRTRRNRIFQAIASLLVAMVLVALPMLPMGATAGASLPAMMLTKPAPVTLPGINDPVFSKLPKAKQQEIIKNAQQKGAGVVCDAIPGVNLASSTYGLCKNLVAPLFTVGKTVVSVAVCSALGAGVPVVGGALVGECTKVISGLITGKGWDAFKGTVFAQAAAAAHSVVKAAQFIANPSGAIDDLANKLKSFSTGLLQSFLVSVTSYQSASLGSTQFRDQYVMAAGLGLAVLAIMFLITCMQAARGSIEIDDLWQAVGFHAPLAVLLMCFGPAIGYVFQEAVNGMCLGIAHIAGQNITNFVATQLNPVYQVTINTLPGGSFAGVACFGLMALGTCTAAFAMLMQNYGLYMVSVMIGIAFGMRMNPTWRARSRKMEASWGALLLFKPAFLLLLAFSFGFLQLPGSDAVSSNSQLTTFYALITIAGVLLILGFAPMGLFKWMPLLPAGNEPGSGGGGGSGAAVAGAAGGVLSQAAMNRSSGGGGGGGGSSGPSPSSSKPSQSGGHQEEWQVSDDKDSSGGPGSMRLPQSKGSQGGSPGSGAQNGPAASTGQAGTAAQGATASTGAAGAGAGGAGAAAGGAGATAGAAALGPIGLGVAAAAQVAQAARSQAHKGLEDSGGSMKEADEE